MTITAVGLIDDVIDGYNKFAKLIGETATPNANTTTSSSSNAASKNTSIKTKTKRDESTKSLMKIENKTTSPALTTGTSAPDRIAAPLNLKEKNDTFRKAD